MKSADYTTVVGLIKGRNESVYSDEVEKLSSKCSGNNLVLNTIKTKEIIVDLGEIDLILSPYILMGTV